MNIDAEQLIENALRDGFNAAVKSVATGYSSPFERLVRDAFFKHEDSIRGLLESSIGSAVKDPEFRQDVSNQVRKSLAKLLVQRFGGEIEKQVNVLKSDPATRARIVLAIEEIVKSTNG